MDFSSLISEFLPLVRLITPSNFNRSHLTDFRFHSFSRHNSQRLHYMTGLHHCTSTQEPISPTFNFNFSCRAAPAPFLAASRTGFSTCSISGLIHTGHHRVPHPRYPQSTLSHRHGTTLHQRHLFLPFYPTHHSRPFFLTFRPLHCSHHLMRGHIPCQHILHQYQPL